MRFTPPFFALAGGRSSARSIRDGKVLFLLTATVAETLTSHELQSGSA